MAESNIPNLKLYLNQSQGQKVYFLGQPVSGFIQMVLMEPKWYQYIAVSLQGKEEVHWSVTSTGSSGAVYTSNFSDNETFLDLLAFVWGNKEAPQPVRIGPGTFKFPFKFNIPLNCPPTFKSNEGQINYRVIGIIFSQVNQYKIEAPVTISRVIDLNLQPNLLQPIIQSTTEDITTCCFNHGAAEITLKVPRTGFCILHERLPVTFECRNGSSRQISVRVIFSQNINYTARGRTGVNGTHWSSKTIDHYICLIPASGSDTKSLEFDLPSSIILGFTSQLIKVSYPSVTVYMLPFSYCSMCASNIPTSVTTIPVVIGNVPFRSVQSFSQGPTQGAGADFPSAEDFFSLQNGYSPRGPAPPARFVTPTGMPEPSTVQSTPPSL